MPSLDVGIARGAPLGITEGDDSRTWLDSSGATVGMDFLTKNILDGRGYQVRLGALTTFNESDIEITTVAAEMSADSVTGLVLMPAHFTCIMESLSGGTLPDTRVMMTATASTGGDPFTPLPLLTGGAVAASSARADPAGGVTVVDDATTTTRLLYGTVIAAIGNFEIDKDLLGRGVVSGAGNIYVVQGTVSAGVEAFLALSYLEFTSSQLGL